MNSASPISLNELSNPVGNAAGVKLNLKRVLERVIRLWYVTVILLMVTLVCAYLVNRYTAKIFPVRASIIIRESEENAGAKFLYNNTLINPYRNFFNEIYIMKSYPLLEEVVTELGFSVSLHREGDIVTSEYYSRTFPIDFFVEGAGRSPWGKSMYFTIKDEDTFEIETMSEVDAINGKSLETYNFNDTVGMHGYWFLAKKVGAVRGVIGQRFIMNFNSPANLAKDYSNRLQATWATQGASVVMLDIQGGNAEKEIDFLNKFIERYQAYDIDKKNKVAVMAMRFLDEQLVMTGDSLRRYEDRVENFKGDNLITGLSEETNRLYQKIQSFEERKFQYRLNESYYKYIDELLSAENYDAVFTPSSVGVSDPVIADLIKQVIELQAEINVYKGNQHIERSRDNPMLKTALQRLSYFKVGIQKAIENSRKTEQINIRFIDDQIALVRGEISKMPRKERELIDIQRNYSLKESLYVFLLQKRTEAGLSKASTTSDIVVVNPPLASPAVSPKVGQNYAIAVASGLMLPLIIFVLMEVSNNRIQSKEDVEGVTSVPFIGSIGHNATDESLVVYKRPRSALAESFRSLRSNLNYFTGSKSPQVFMVTSAIPGEGKSFTSINLSTVFAMAGKRTVLLGADLRRPKLADELKLNNNVGLSQFLSEMASLDKVMQVTEVANLTLIAGGPMPPNPSELLLRPLMDKLMLTLREMFDVIVIDTPPLSYVADAFVLAKYVDHTLYVVRQNFTPSSALVALHDQYEMGKLVNISVLFNDLRKTGLGYGYSGYGYGYGYGYYDLGGGKGYYEEN